MITLNKIVDYPDYGAMYAPYPESSFDASTGLSYIHNVELTQKNNYVLDVEVKSSPDRNYGFTAISKQIPVFPVSFSFQ